ncbi:protein kinase [Idiomarina sp.]|uniref:protein kinase domain-containing protein n=1 Tax=Idiomarina sp. TaxID=1874361 RepID=UPI0026132C9C|nr:protein kinase [Idiomarina sp.]
MAISYSRDTFPYPIPERYQCEGLLGYGGSGLVYKAYDERLQRSVAVKFARSPSLVSRNRLVREARLLSQVSHPSLCRVYDIGEPEVTSSSLFLVMEYVEGTRLDKLNKHLSVNDAVEITYQLANALSALHKSGYAHNDVKGHNIILSKQKQSDVPVLVDLSIAENVSRESQQQDIYQVGELLLLLLASMTPDIFLMQPVADKRRLPSGLADIIKKALAVDSYESFTDMSELANTLAKWRAKSYKQRRRLGWTTALTASTLILGGLALTAFNKLDTYESIYSAPVHQHSHGQVFAHYTEHLIEDGSWDEAQETAELALSHFDNAISEHGDDLTHHRERIEFLLELDPIFSDTEYTTRLLNALNSMGAPAKYSRPDAAYHVQAKAYLALARVNQKQEHLRARWVEQAWAALSSAQELSSAEHYLPTQKMLEKFQSSGGTD